VLRLGGRESVEFISDRYACMVEGSGRVMPRICLPNKWHTYQHHKSMTPLKSCTWRRLFFVCVARSSNIQPQRALNDGRLLRNRVCMLDGTSTSNANHVTPEMDDSV
jgi:hypothetical protein